MRLAVYNVENLFERSRVMNQDTWTKGKEILPLFAELNKLLGETVYTPTMKKRMVTLLIQLGLRDSDSNRFLILRRSRGKLIHRFRDKSYLTLAPAVLLLTAVVPDGLKLTLGGAAAFVFVAISFLLSQIGADFGKHLERRLWHDWGGPPTTRFLQHGNQEFNEITRGRVHENLKEEDA